MAAKDKKVQVGVLLDGYVKADSRNLPKVDILMVISFFNESTDHIQPGCEHQKLQRSKGENYSSDAVGYVQLKRDVHTKTCTVAARVTPENRVNAKPYAVSVVVDEQQQYVTSGQCADCVAAAGGCKHVAALLGWLSTRSADVAVTATESYWKKARLSCVPSVLKTAGAEHLRPSKRKAAVENAENKRGAAFLTAVLDMEKEVQEACLLFDHMGSGGANGTDSVWMDKLLNGYLPTTGSAYSYSDFVQYASSVMTEENCEAVREATVEQSECRLWRNVRFGRVTASRAHEVAHCSKVDGTLVASILGASKLKDTAALMRGRRLEPQVVRVAEQELGPITSSGIILRPQYPIFGASPDGVTGDGAIVEVKCPTTSAAKERFVSEDGVPGAKVYAQLQLTMRMAGTASSYLCVAAPDFEATSGVEVVHVPADDAYCDRLMADCVAFWVHAIFPKLCNQYLALMAA